MDKIPSAPEELFNALCERIPDAMAKHKVPGVALGITCDGGEFMRGLGVTSVAHPLPVTERTLFQIGSITKTFTATAAMRLVEAGKIALEAPIRTYLRDFKMRDAEVTARLTMRHLLTHTGGWQGDYFPDTGSGDDALAKYVSLMSKLPQLTPLGSIWSYNNAGFSLAGRVIEVVTGKTFEAALKELVLEPLGLRRSFLFPTEVMLHSFATGHAVIADRSIVLSPWHLTRASAAAGGIAASMKDLMRYARFHLNDGTAADGMRVLSRESMEFMQTPAHPAFVDIKMGLAWWIYLKGGPRRVYHGGGTYGQVSNLTLVPERNFAIAVTTNQINGQMLITDILRDVVAQFLGLDLPEPAKIAMTSEQMKEYAGHYAAGLGDFEVKFVDDKLMVHAHSKGGFPTSDVPPPKSQAPPFQIDFVDGDRFAITEQPLRQAVGEFLRGPDGAIKWMHMGGRLHARNR